MTLPVQGTDSMLSFMGLLNFSSDADATIAGFYQDSCHKVATKANDFPVYMPNNVYPSFLRAIYSSLNDIGNEQVCSDIRDIIKTILNIALSLQNEKLIEIIFQKMHLFSVEDGSALLEWIFEDYRIGFGIEPDREESSWYLVTKENLGNINAYGSLSGIDNRNIVTWLINFINVNL